MLRLNAISKSIIDAIDVKDNSSVKLNSASGVKELSRKEVIALGRLVACEYFGNIINSNKNAIEKYNSKLTGTGFDYHTIARNYREKELLYCATRYCNVMGQEAPANFDEFKRDNEKYSRNSMFLNMLAAIDNEVIAPMFFDVLDSVGMGLMQVETIPSGATKEIEVKSNDVFLFEDSAYGSVRSSSRNAMYSKTITLNPHPYVASVSIKWYQDYVNGDAGYYFGALVNGMYSKMYAKLMAALSKAVEGGKYIPAGLQAATYTTANWIKITDLVAAANGVSVDNLMAIGSRQSLNAIVPVDGTGAAILGMQYGLGEEWFRNGYLAKAGQVDLLPVAPTIVPGTQNSTLDTIGLDDNIYIVAKGGYGYKPLYTAVFEGSPVTLELEPSKTANLTIDLTCTASFDTQPVFASKVGVIKAVV